MLIAPDEIRGMKMWNNVLEPGKGSTKMSSDKNDEECDATKMLRESQPV
jgi:hypothetical protein